MTEKKKVQVAKKPNPKKKPKIISPEEYNKYLEREVINIVKLKQFYSEVQKFEKGYYISCQDGMRRHYPDFEWFGEFLEQQTEEHLENLERIVKRRYPSL